MSDIENGDSSRRGLLLESKLSSNASTEAASEDQFVPVGPPPRPPGKWQLALLISTWVWLAELCGRRIFREFIAFNGWVDPNFVSFIQVAGNLGVLFYTVVDVLMPLLTFTYKGRQYGFGPWISYRATWLKQYKNFPMQIIAGAVTILEEGFRITDAPAVNLEGDHSVVMHIKYFVRLDKFNDFVRWVAEINDICMDFGGESIGSEWTEPEQETIDDVLREAIAYGASRTTQHNEMKMMQSRRQLIQGVVPQNVVGESNVVTHEVNIHFENSHYLNLWLASPQRHELYEQLQYYVARIEEVSFTDNSQIANLPPVKWKAWMLNTMGQFLAAKWANAVFLPYYHDQWNLDSWSRVSFIFLFSCVVNFAGFYFLSPLMALIFSNWVIRKPSEVSDQEPWKTLNEGIENYYIKVEILILWYGSFVMWRVAYNDWSI